MGTLKPKAGNANYCSAGQLSPLFNDPYYRTIGLGTRIFLGGGQGYVTWHGTQHKPAVPRTEGGVPLRPAGTLWVMGDMKQMSAEWIRGVSIQGYGCSLSVGLGIPIPIIERRNGRLYGGLGRGHLHPGHRLRQRLSPRRVPEPWPGQLCRTEERFHPT